MTAATPEDFATLVRRCAASRWLTDAYVNQELCDLKWTDLGGRRLLEMEAILRELGPLSEGERAALRCFALDYAKTHRRRLGL